MSAVLKAVAKGLTTTVVFFIVAEALLHAAYAARNATVRYIPLPYAFGDDYGPMPPWLDSLEILRSDPSLIWRNKPNAQRTYLDVYSPVHTEADRLALLRQFTTRIPAEFRANHTWEVRLNSDGYRGDDLPVPTPQTVRIVCIGDSWTFGMPVNQDETYPARLGEWLRRERPDNRYEVHNLGVLGYSSFQGLELMKTRLADLRPQVVVIGFGMNDSNVAGYRDKDIVGASSMAARAKSVLKESAQNLETYKLLKYVALRLTFQPKPIDEYIRHQSETHGSDPTDYDSLEPWTRVSPRDYESNLREMIRLAAGVHATVILLDNELWEGSPYRPVLRRLSSELNVPLIDSLALIGEERRRIERDLEAKLGLAPAASTEAPPTTSSADRTPVVFRVYQGSADVQRALSIAGVDAELGSGAPNTIDMRDDGRGGDQVAGDRVWSYTANLPGEKQAFYVYTNSGTRGRWEGLDVPHVRTVEVPRATSGVVYLPIETFGRVYMQGDDWHTDKVGYDLIGHAVARQIESLH